MMTPLLWQLCTPRETPNEKKPTVPVGQEDLEAQVTQLRAQLAAARRVQSKYKLVEEVHQMQGSADAAQMVVDRATKWRACGEDIPTSQQGVNDWLFSKHLEMEDDLEMGENDIVRELAQVIAPASTNLECVPASMVSHMVT